MYENNRCSILFHLLVPGGKWQTVISKFNSFANCCSEVFQSLVRELLLPPPSAVISNFPTSSYWLLPMFFHHSLMLNTANSEVSLDTPTFTKASFFPISYTP